MLTPGAAPGRWALPLGGGCWLVLAVLGVCYAGDRAAGTVDGALRGLVLRGVAAHPGVLRVLVTPSDIPVVLGLLVLGCAVFLVRRRWTAAALLAGCPVLAVLLTEFVLKPVIDRRYGTGGILVMPSGHTVALVCVLAVLVLCLPDTVPAAGRLRRGPLFGVAVLLVLAAAVGMVGLRYHYPADVLGGVCTALGVVTPCWWAGCGLSRRRENLVVHRIG